MTCVFEITLARASAGVGKVTCVFEVKLARASAGMGKVTCVFDLEGYGAPETVMPPFQARLPRCAPHLCKP